MTAIRHVLELVAAKQIVLPSSVVTGLGDALDEVLDGGSEVEVRRG